MSPHGYKRRFKPAFLYDRFPAQTRSSGLRGMAAQAAAQELLERNGRPGFSPRPAARYAGESSNLHQQEAFLAMNQLTPEFVLELLNETAGETDQHFAASNHVATSVLVFLIDTGFVSREQVRDWYIDALQRIPEEPKYRYFRLEYQRIVDALSFADKSGSSKSIFEVIEGGLAESDPPSAPDDEEPQ